MLRISFLNLLLSSGTLTPSLAEPVAISIIHPISLQFNLMTPQTSVPSHFVTLHQPHFSSTLQPSTHIHPCYDHLIDGPRRICNIPASVTSIPTGHSWSITAHISLGNLEQHWKLFKWQLARMKQFLSSLEQHPLASPQVLTTLQL